MMNEKVNILEKGACWPVQMLLQKVLCSSQKCNFLLSLNQDAVDATLDPMKDDVLIFLFYSKRVLF